MSGGQAPEQRRDQQDDEGAAIAGAVHNLFRPVSSPETMKKVEAISGHRVRRENFLAEEAGAETGRLEGGNFDGVLSAARECRLSFLNEEYRQRWERQGKFAPS